MIKGPGVFSFCESGWTAIADSLACVVYDRRRDRGRRLPLQVRNDHSGQSGQDEEMNLARFLEAGMDERGEGKFQRPAKLEICSGCKASFPSHQVIFIVYIPIS